MAHNSGYYQGQPVQQQQQQPQYSPVFQQPQNIYQQLGKPQPQPHLQTHATYTVPLQQPQQQLIQSQGFQFSQPQYVQGPPQPQQIQAPYVLSQTPYSSSQTPYPPSQTPYIPSQTPFSSQTPYPLSQTPYAPAQITYPQQQQQQPSPQYVAPQQQQVQTVYAQPAQPQIPLMPTSSFPTQSSSAVPLNSTGSSWRVPASRPPPIALSASLAQQAQVQAQSAQPPMQMQQQQPQQQTSLPPPQQQHQQPQAPPPQQQQKAPPTPQTPGRRPLPQPAPGVNAKTPALPPANTPKRIPTLPTPSDGNAIPSGSSKPFPIQPIQTNLPQASKTPSPTRGRPLPTPAETGNKRNTVDLGKIAHPGLGSSAGSSAFSNSSASSASSSGWATRKTDTSPTRSVLPSLAERQTSNNSNAQLSRTSSYAVDLNASSDSTATKTISVFPKRRESPPRFQSAPSSESNSPTKDIPSASAWNHSNSSSSTNVSSSSSAAAPRAIVTTSSHSSSHTKASIDANFVASPTSATSSNAPPKKFVPMWRRTIPEMPAPAWGYAAGMVSEPHPQPPPQPEPPAPAQTAVSSSPEKPKSKGGKLKKLFKGSSSTPPVVAAPVTIPPPVVAPAARATQYQQNPSQVLNLGYPRANANPVQQRYPAYQQQIAQYAQPQPQPRAYGSQPQQQYQYQQQQQEEDDEEEEEETEEDESEKDEEAEAEETEETEEDESDHRYRVHSRQHSQPQAQSKNGTRMRSQSRGRHAYEEDEEEQEQTPKRKVLRPKASKPDPYGAYNEISPSGKAKIKPKAISRRIELDEIPSPRTKLRPKAKALTRSTLEDEEEEDVDLERTPKKSHAIHERERQILDMRRLKHERSRSAFEERDIVRHRREPSEREQRPRSGSAFAGSAPAKRSKARYEEEDDDDDASIRLAYDDDEEDDDDDSELEWLKKQKVMKKKRAAAAREEERKQASSPQYGIRDLKPASRRAGSGSGSGTASASRYGGRFEEPNDEEEEEHDYRLRRLGTAERPSNRNGKESEWEFEQADRRYQNAGMGMGKGSGLPQPPIIMRDASTGQEKQIRGGPRLKSAPIKFDDYDPDEHRRQVSARENLPMQFSAMNVNGNRHETRDRSDSRGSAHSSAHSSAWPVDLPRLPRTPGSATTPGSVMNDGGGYFDIKPQAVPNTSNHFSDRQSHGHGEINRNNYRDRIQNHRTNLDLDDPPPQATVVRTPSPGPTGYTLSQRRELPQPQGRPQSQAFPPSAERVAEQLSRRRSLYNPPSAPIHQQDNMAKQRRPQSQVYNVQSSQMHQQHNHQMGRSHPPTANSAHFSSTQLNHPLNATRQQPQTPAPPPTVGIESPHPVGGREKLADIPKMEEDSNDGSDTELRGGPRIQVDSAPPSIPMINVNSSPMENGNGIPMINIDSMDNGSPRMRSHAPQPPQIQVFEVPGISVAGPFDGPSINISGPGDHQHGYQHQQHHQQQQQHSRPLPPQSRPQTGSEFSGRQSRPGAGGLICGGCNGPIIGRIVSAMGSRYHPACFKCTVCDELLEHVSSYEHEGRPYCHLDYHENFAPKCYSCKTAIIEEQFISLDDPALGKRAYHTQHFFCSECGDPFLTPSGGLPTNAQGELAVTGDGEFEGFTVYKGYPYCEACHVRLRLPKCKRCKRSIRDNDEAVEALGGKWCWACFVCASCNKPFENPSFFQRDDQPYCEHCFSVMLRNEI